MIVKFPVTQYNKLLKKTQTVLIPVTLESDGKGKLAVSFPFCPPLVDDFKNMGGAQWLGHDKKNPRKIWLIDDSARNKFRMDTMRWQGTKGGIPILGDHDPYWRYELPIVSVPCEPRLFENNLTPYYGHQQEGVEFVVTRRQCILAWDMGTGKTLVIGTAMEWAKTNLGWDNDGDDFWFVCKKGALYEVQLGFLQWDVKIRPRFLSYDDMRRAIETWPRGKKPPKFVVFDESTQIKSPTALRSGAALHLADSMRGEHRDPFVVCMTGTPSPKNPCDWWMQAEVACPGYIREGDWTKFRRRLCIIQKNERSGDGGVYNTVKKDMDGNQCWYDDERRCKDCGEFVEHQNHKAYTDTGVGKVANSRSHTWVASVNEVLLIDSRLKGFVSKKLKKDCLDLPERIYVIKRCRATQQVRNAAQLVAKSARGAADALTKLRELSDGFQYADVAVDQKVCPMCSGSKTMMAKMDPENPGLPPSDEARTLGRLVNYEKVCDQCNGAGEIDIVQRQTIKVACPKDDVLEEIIEEHGDVGRLAVYCGFTGSVDRVVDVFLKNEWSVVRVDGRGWKGFAAPGAAALPMEGKELYHTFRFGQKTHPKLAFVAQASTAAHGLNFDCTPTIVNYSRDFNFENALQGDERNMRGRIAETLKAHGRTHCTVVDIVHLPSDDYILDNHKKKRRLQALTLGEVQASTSAPDRIAST